jgi:hypothetical protein
VVEKPAAGDGQNYIALRLHVGMAGYSKKNAGAITVKAFAYHRKQRRSPMISTQPQWVRSIVATIAGIGTLFFGVFLTIALVAFFSRGLGLRGFGAAVVIFIVGILLGVCVGGIGSGYVAGRIAGHAFLAHALAVPIATWIITVAIFHIGKPQRSGFPFVYILPALLFCTIGGWIGERKADVNAVENDAESM